MSRAAASSILRVKIKLLHTRFEIVRVVDLSSRLRLADVHQLIQAVMPWGDCHVHQFRSQHLRWGIPDSDFEDFGIEVRDERITTIGVAFEAAGTEPLVYLYDFGDGWEHALTLEDVFAPDGQTAYPLLIEAVGASPPDDVGGVAGYRQFVAALTNPNAPDPHRYRRWYGRSFDPDQIDTIAIRDRLSILKKHWERRRI